MLGLTLGDLVEAVGGLLTQQELKLLEGGRLCPTDEQVRALCDVLHLPLEQVVPGRVRLIVDVDQGQMITSGMVATFVPAAEPDDVLLNYLACITTCRRTRPGTYVAPRQDDLEVLGVALDETSMWVRQRLVVLSREQRDHIRIRARSIAQRSMLPSLGMFVAYTRVGALLLIDAEAMASMPVGPVGPTASDEQGHRPSISETDFPDACAVVSITSAVDRNRIVD